MHALKIKNFPLLFDEKIWEITTTLNVEVCGLEIHDEENPAYILAYIESKQDAEKLQQEIARDHVELKVSVDKIPNLNWNQSWEDQFDQYQAGPWNIKNAEIYLSQEHQPYDIYLKPSSSFGFGSHQSTRLMLQAMEAEKKKLVNASCLDFGSGTGVLSIAAKKLGAQSVEGVEKNLSAISEGFENSKINHCKIVFSEKLNSKSQQYDCVFMNVLFPVQQDWLPYILKNHTHKDSLMILAGFLTQDLENIKNIIGKFFPKKSLTLLQEDKWICLIYK